MTEALSPGDRSSLTAERGPVNMAVHGVIVAEAGDGVTYDALGRRVEERLHLLPRYRQKLREPTLGLVNPVWVDDEHFDAGWHLRQASLPAPGGDAELAAYVARESARLMDRTRPLWELHLVEGLANDRIALVAKMHHALVDGMAAAGIGSILLDLEPDPPPLERPREEWEPQEYRLHGHLARLATGPLGRGQALTVRAIDQLLEGPVDAVARARRATELVAALARNRPAPPKLPINRKISPNRSYALTRVDLTDVKAAGKAAGGTVNDAILAAVSGMLARYLDQAGLRPGSLERDPVALVPVSVRSDGDDELGNRISVVFVDLPVGEPDPRRRVTLLHERMDAIKGSAQVAAGSLLVDATGFAPPLLSSVVARAGGGTASFNLVVSNVPGPQFPLYISGSRVLAIHPVVPLNPADQGLNVGVFSYDGAVNFGLTADRALDPPLAEAAKALDEALAELISTGGSGLGRRTL